MDTSSLIAQQNQLDPAVGDSYLRIQIDMHTPAILSMDYVQEVLVVATERIAPVPNMPEYVLGLFNRRNRVFWALDLAQMLNLQSVHANNQQYHMAILRVDEVPLGIVVQEIKGVTRFPLPSVRSPQGLVKSNLIPYLDGCIIQQQLLLVLNAVAIVHSSTPKAGTENKEQ